MAYSINDGVRTYYEVYGEGFPLIMIHANPFDHNLWMYQIISFSQNFKVIAPDLRGYGRSDKPLATFSLKDMAEDILCVCRKEGVQEAILFGASVGSGLALLLAIDNPGFCKALVLVGGSSKGGRVEKRIRGYREIGVEKYRIQHMKELVGDDFRNSTLGRYLFRVFEKSNFRLSGEAIARIFQARAGEDMTPFLADLKVPALVINGEFDHSLPAGRMTAKMIPGAQHRTLPGTGHACCIEDPAGFDALVEAFLIEQGLMQPEMLRTPASRKNREQIIS